MAGLSRRSQAGPWRAVVVGGGGRRVLDLCVDRGDVEVDLVDGRDGGVTGREVGRDPLGDPAITTAPAADRGVGHGQASGLAGRIRRQPVRVRRMPSASGGPSTSPGAASRSVSAGRSSNML